MKIFKALFVLLIFTGGVNAQTIVNSYQFPNWLPLQRLWGVVNVSGDIWVGTDFNNGAYPFTKLYKLDNSGSIIDSITTPFDFNHGTAWDGTGYWIAEDYRTSGARLYKINTSGSIIDSIYLPALIGGNLQGVGDIEIIGNSLWFTIYEPDFPAYPKAYAYEMDLTTRNILDTIPMIGGQPHGITLKGDTIFYVVDDNDGDPERVYAYRKAVGDTIFSFSCPDEVGDDRPKGMHWDGQFLWLIADSVGGAFNSTLYKYDLSGQGNAIISTSPSSLQFGSVEIGDSANVVLTISNTGTSDLIVSNFNMTNPVFKISSGSLPDTIAPASGKDYTVTFKPTQYDTTSGMLRISSNDGGTPVKTVNLSGIGVFSGSHISVSASSYDYGQRRLNSLCGYIFEVTNQGGAPLQINSFNFTTDRFSFDTVGISLPVLISSQETREFRAWFNPNAVSTFADSLIISSNAGNDPSATIGFSGEGVNNTTALGDIMWQGIVPDNPNTGFDDYQSKSIKQIGDVNGDGVNDVIVGTANYWVICYNGNSSVTSDAIWKINNHLGSGNVAAVVEEEALQLIPDVDGDAIADIVYGTSGPDNVYCVSGRTGLIIWQYAGNNQGEIKGLRTDKDYNGDTRRDVIVSANGTGMGNGRHAVICLNGMNGQEIFNTTQAGDFTYDVVSTESGGAIGNGSNIGPYQVNGFNNAGVTAWSYPVSSSTWGMMKVPDISNDGIDDIIGLYGFGSNIFAITGDAGAEIWARQLPDSSSTNAKFILLDDLDGNGFIDFSLSGPKAVYRVDTKTNDILWENYLDDTTYIRGIDNIGDINGDSVQDLAITSQVPPKIVVLDGQSGSSLFTYSLGGSINQRGDRISRLDDIDNNVSNEFIGSSRDGRIICFSGGPDATVSVEPIAGITPDKYSLSQNYPNPFNPVTNISFDIPKNSNVKLVVYDMLGREVINLVNSELNAGSYTVKFDASKFATGVYFYKLDTQDFVGTKKMLLIK